MDTTHFAALRQTLTAAASRRGVLGALSGGLLTAGPLALQLDESDARKKAERKRKRKNKKKDRKQRGPVTRADAICSAAEGIGVFTNPNERLAQTFTAIASGSLVRTELRLFKDVGASGDYILHLGAVDSFNVPTNEVLAVASIPSRDVPEQAESTVTFTFATPFAVKANATYALVLTQTGVDFFSWRGTKDDLCVGQAFFSPDRTAPFEPAFLRNSTDFNFTTFVRS